MRHEIVVKMSVDGEEFIASYLMCDCEEEWGDDRKPYLKNGPETVRNIGKNIWTTVVHTLGKNGDQAYKYICDALWRMP